MIMLNSPPSYEQEAILEAKRGGHGAIEWLMQHKLHLIESAAMGDDYQGTIDEKLATARLGFLVAIQSFDPSKEKFDVHVSKEMRRQLKTETGEILEGRTLTSANERKDVKTIKNALDWLNIELGREPSIQEIADFTGLTEERIRKMSFLVKVESLDVAGEEANPEPCTLREAVFPERDYWFDRWHVIEALQALDPNHVNTLWAYCGPNCEAADLKSPRKTKDKPTYDTAASELGISIAEFKTRLAEARKAFSDYLEKFLD